MAHIRISDASRYLGVSDDTVRRWIDQGVLTRQKDESGRACVDGLELAKVAASNAVLPADPADIGRSARNRFTGIITAVTSDTVMSQVEIQCGINRVVSLLSTEAVRDLGLEPGKVATAVIKSTNVIVEVPR
ncbi:TOBE domain-containing protein [Dermabacteraceae bacterium P13115]|nr:TOBE domain-containing protein [Dermabacteraceae bacterium TAE3-ERU27]MBV7433275.1 TOBE domain-containing protein [Dermabacteraceae bacterium TAE3-ERU5]